MSEIERLAEALFWADVREREETVSGDMWTGLQRSSKRKWLNMARAAIEALRPVLKPEFLEAFDRDPILTSQDTGE